MKHFIEIKQLYMVIMVEESMHGDNIIYEILRLHALIILLKNLYEAL